jgi:ATP-dependent RNA helicase RhlE
MTFENLNIIEEILKTLKSSGYTEPTPIQEQTIPLLLNGEDILGSAQTGTGKTAAFAIPILQNLYKNNPANGGFRKIKALILTPTRELATQIKDSFVTYGKNLGFKTTVIYGGVNQNSQTKVLTAGVDILVATPGRLIDLIGQRFVDLKDVKYFVLDEADRMLDMGFINDVQKIVAKIPAQRQTMLFSATMPKEIAKLANDLLTNPKRIAVVPVEETIDVIKQSVYKVIKKDKFNLLYDLLSEDNIHSALIFTRTKHGANKLVTELGKAGVIAAAIHGNKSQTARETALRQFKNHQLKVLVATDIAARGIDINELSHVINYELPEVPETYIHRIGRTGRAGHEGIAITFCNPEEAYLLYAIEKHINMQIPVATNHKYVSDSSLYDATTKPKNTNSSKGKTENTRSRFDRGSKPENKGYGRAKENKEGRPEKSLYKDSSSFAKSNDKKVSTSQTGDKPFSKFRKDSYKPSTRNDDKKFGEVRKYSDDKPRNNKPNETDSDKKKRFSNDASSANKKNYKTESTYAKKDVRRSYSKTK